MTGIYNIDIDKKKSVTLGRYVTIFGRGSAPKTPLHERLNQRSHTTTSPVLNP
jgi:hypothetical protein